MTRALAITLILFAFPSFADEPAPPAASQPAASTADIDALQKEYERLRDNLFASRARAAAVGSALYGAKLQVYLKWGTPRSQRVSRTEIRLDGAIVYQDTSGTIGVDDAIRYDGFVAPGKHRVTIAIDAEAKDDAAFATTVENSFVVDVPAKKRVVLKARAEDGGDMGYRWSKKSKGGYRLRVDADATAEAMPNGG